MAAACAAGSLDQPLVRDQRLRASPAADVGPPVVGVHTTHGKHPVTQDQQSDIETVVRYVLLKINDAPQLC